MAYTPAIHFADENIGIIRLFYVVFRPTKLCEHIM